MLTSASLLDPERLFGRFALLERPALIVAISGGSDSTALLHLLHHYLVRHGRADRLLAVTVDHALRAEAAAEARQVGQVCANLGLPHRILRWDEPKPSSGLAAAARAARYRLLMQAADEAGSDIILTGHTADDQAETVAMRAARGRGIGLAGMAPDTLLDNRAWLLRPLLEISRHALRANLTEEDIGWIDDPSNDDPASERVRVRQALDRAGRSRLLEAGAGAARRREDLARRAALLIATGVRKDGERVRLSPLLFEATDRAAALHAFRLILSVVGRGEQFPDEERSEALFRNLCSLGFSASLAGCVAVHRRAGITLRREQRGKAPADALPLTKTFHDAPLRRIIPGFDLTAFRALAKALAAPGIPRSPFRPRNVPFP